MTAKYFPQLGYEDLYVCVQQADAQAAPERWREPQLVRDLRTQVLVSSAQLPKLDCATRLGPEWPEFQHDVAYFAARNEELRPGRWLETFRDHGVNVTPLWAFVSHSVVAHFEASATLLNFLSIVDFLWVVGALALIGYGWGTNALAVAVLFVSLNEASRPGWIFGSIFRLEWFFLLVLGAFLVRHKKPIAALVVNGVSNLFRPVSFLVPLALCWLCRRRGRALAAAAAFLLFLLFVPGLGQIEAFVQNSQRYMASFLSNSMGLQPLVITPTAAQLKQAGEDLMSESPALSQVDPSILREKLYTSILSQRRQALWPWTLAGALALIALGLWTLQTQPPLTSYILTSALSIFLLGVPSYYHLGMVLLVLLPQAPLVLIFVGLSLSKLIPLIWGLEATSFQILSAIWLLLVLVTFGGVLSRRSRPPGSPHSPPR
jgi:hypothetical protein